MSSWSEAAAAVAAPVERPRSAARPERRPKARGRTAGAVVWIVVAAILLAGVVALNVAVLQRNLALDRLARERAQLRADNVELVSRLASAAQAAKIEQLARRLGLVPADPAAFTYVNLAQPAK
jgi:cell division protein FtsL